MNLPEATVECYSGQTYAQEPRAVVWQGHRDEVEEVVARWRLPEGPAFRVRTRAGFLLDLHYDEGQDRWIIQQRGSSRASGGKDPIGMSSEVHP